jgi:Dolichyl-phosphate-mannose-protein mannosyltransferase
VLIGLIAVGVGLRVVALISWWPVTPTLEDGYQRFAANPFLDLQHSAGYGLIIAALGHVTRQIGFTVLVQHLVGLATAPLYWAAIRRLTGSSWAGLLPAAIVLLDPDDIFLEHSIMSESWMLLAVAVGLYAAARTITAPERCQRWALVSGAALAVAVMIRSAALPLILTTGIAVLIGAPAAREGLRPRLRAAAALAGVFAVLMLSFAVANEAFGDRFAISPSPGWYLYGRVAQFADCRRFTPPPGTRALCQRVSPARRPSAYNYMFTPQSPGVRLFGGFGHQDTVVGGWARRALEAQPGDFLATAWAYLRSYYVPSSLPARLKGSTGLDPQLEFTATSIFEPDLRHDLEGFYAGFTVTPRHWGLQLLHDIALVIRFGAALLSITTVLTLIGLFVGPRRSRVAVLLFGGGGLSLLVIPVLLSTYAGRYTVPMAAPMVAAAGVVLHELVTAVNRRRQLFAAHGAGAAPATGGVR